MGETIARAAQPTKRRRRGARAGRDARLAMVEQLDLRGVKCPLNWAKARVRLEELATGNELELILDDPKGVRDIPRAAEAVGYVVIEIEQCGAEWRILIQV